MRQLRHPFAALIVACGMLGACGSDGTPAATGSSPTGTQPPADSSTAGADATQPVSVGGDFDCAALKDNLTNMSINWQVVIGLSNSPATEWSEIPIGSLAQFGDQLAVITAALGSDAEAAAALAFMSGANDIVERGMGGDAAAQDELVAYLGADIGANVGKQLPIVLAYQDKGCE